MALARRLGHVDGGQEEALELLCRAAQTELAGRLQDGGRPEDCREAFALACAWLALAGLAAGTGGAAESFTAGDLSIRTRSGADADQRAAALRLQAETVLGPYLKDRGFAFQGVEG